LKNTITKIGNDFKVVNTKEKLKVLREALIEGEESGICEESLRLKLEKMKKRLDKLKKIV